jgi:hypothetical protein
MPTKTIMKPGIRISGPIITTVFVLGLATAQANAQPFSRASEASINYTLATNAPSRNCESLASLQLPEVISITATSIAAEDNVPAHCRVQGTIAPEVTFQVNLPAGWNGRFYMVGNGGPAGQHPDTQASARADALRNGFVMGATDTGHDSVREPGYTFAMSNLQKRLDYAYRAVHMTAVTAKAVANAYYGRPVDHAYWNSCSNGGRQGLLEAQRYPYDFDGVIANAPWVDQTGFAMGAVWNQQQLDDVGLTQAKVSLLAERVLQKCDAIDGLADGLIDDPRACNINVIEDVPQCPAGNNADACLTTEQSMAIQAVYDGPRNSAGKQIHPGFMPGGEVAWFGTIVPNAQGNASVFGLGNGILQYMVPLQPNTEWNYRSFNFDTDTEQSDRWSRLADASDINLRPFRENGGKLLITYGWADQILQPLMGVHYYEQAVTANGANGEDFMRLFMIPGMTHCAGGYGPDSHDPVTAMIDWVEAGIAPDMMIGSRIEQGEVVRTRPLCPYPAVARYDGSGSIDDAANFSCSVP